MPLIGTITSLQNPQVKLVRRLKTKKRDRYRERRYLIEGYRLVQHMVARGHRPAIAFYTADFVASGEYASLIETLVAGPTQVYEVSPEVLAELADTVTPQGIVALMPIPEHAPADAADATLLLIIDRLRMPGNMGTILRTALATGVDAVACSQGTVDPYAPKVVRGAMGAHVDLMILPDMAWHQIAYLVGGRQCVLAEAQGEVPLWEVDWTVSTALIVSSEAHGAGREARRLATRTAYIPMAEGAESLNAAIAAAGFLLEAQRQRFMQRP